MPTKPDPVIEACKQGIDATLIRENLRRTPEERLANLQALQDFVARFGRAAWMVIDPKRAAGGPKDVETIQEERRKQEP
jgi:hypothetical protein